MGVDIIATLERAKSAAIERDRWRAHWQDLANLLHPMRGSFTQATIPGQEVNTKIYDSTPMQARRGLATAIDGLMKPATARWFWMKAEEEDLNEVDEAKTWFDAVRERMWSAIYSPKARFIQHSGAVDNDLATFGLGHLWIAERSNRDGLSFRSLHIGDVAFEENSDGQIDSYFITRRFTARQAAQRWGEGKLPPKIAEFLRGPEAAKNANRLFEFVQAVQPRHDYDQRRVDNLNMPISNCVISLEDQFLVEESGFHEMPIATPRWEVAANEVFPRSPGMIALPDARTLQAMGRTLLIGGQRAVDPPTWVVDDGMMSAVRTFPGGLTTVNAETVRETGGRPIGTLEMGANIPIGREMQDDYRRMVESAFFRNVFGLPVDGPEMTATEVIERKEEFIRTIGPTLGQLENDYIGVTIDRVFGIMIRARQFPDAPEALQGQGARFEFMSPIQRARKQIEVAGMGQAFQFIAPLIELQPEIADNLDGDEIIRDLPDSFQLPQKWIRSTAKVEELRAARQQVQEGQGGLMEGQQAADIAATLAGAGVDLNAAMQPQEAA